MSFVDRDLGGLAGKMDMHHFLRCQNLGKYTSRYGGIFEFSMKGIAWVRHLEKPLKF